MAELPLEIDKPEMQQLRLDPTSPFYKGLFGDFDYAASLSPLESNHAFERMKIVAEAYYEGRRRRADEVERAIVDLLPMRVRFHGEHVNTYYVDCIDGRHFSSNMMAYIPGAGGFLRTQAGDLADFKDDLHGDGVRIQKDSPQRKKLRGLALQHEPVNSNGELVEQVVIQSIDTHVACAAQEIKSTEHPNGNIADKGLRDGLQRAIRVARGIHEIDRELENEGRQNRAKLYPDHFTYDPHHGTMIIGLEQYALSLEDTDLPAELKAAIEKDGFTAANISELSKLGKIVDTHELLLDEDLIAALKDITFNGDYRNNYYNTLKTVWESILDLYEDGNGDFYINILDRVRKAYGHNADQMPEELIVHKAKLLMKNTISRWIVARNSFADTHDHGSKNPWPYSDHRERIVVISEGQYGPFEGDIDAFEVAGFLPPEMIIKDALLGGLGIIPKLRADESISDVPDLVEDPVFIGNEAVLRNISETSWEYLEQVNFDLLRSIQWDDPEVIKWEKPHIKAILTKILALPENASIQPQGTLPDGLKLVDKMYELFNRYRQCLASDRMSANIMNGKIHLETIITDRSRRPRFTIPFVHAWKEGEENQRMDEFEELKDIAAEV